MTTAKTITILGRPSVGKSTILNKISGKNLSITASNAQTTRGVTVYNYNKNNVRAKFYDTPGYVTKTKHLLDKMLNKAAMSYTYDCDYIFVVVNPRLTKSDIYILENLAKFEHKLIIVVNKIDKFKFSDVNASLAKIKEVCNYYDVILLCALESIAPIDKFLAQFKSKQIDDSKEEELVIPSLMDAKIEYAELIREQVFRYTGAEVPRGAAVKVYSIEDHANLVKIYANIIVDKKSHRKIVLGKNGDRIKTIGTVARKSLEERCGKKVFLKLTVYVEPNWANSEKMLIEYGALTTKEYSDATDS